MMEEKFYTDEAKRIFNTENPTKRQIDAVKLATFGHVFEAMSLRPHEDILKFAFDKYVRENHQIFLIKDEQAKGMYERHS